MNIIHNVHQKDINVHEHKKIIYKKVIQTKSITFVNGNKYCDTF